MSQATRNRGHSADINRTALVCLAAAFLAVCLLPACRRDSVGGGSSSQPRIALIMKSLGNDFFSTMRDGAVRHHKAHAEQYELIVNGISDERDLAGQIALVEQMAAQGVDAIVIAPADSKALAPALKRAQQAGIVVINIDNKLDAGVLEENGMTVPFVGPNNLSGAATVATYLAEQLPEGAPVGLIEGIPTAFNSQQRRAGFEQAMRNSGHKIVSVQSGQWESSVANRIATGMLSEHPEIRALLCANDNMALGALAAVKAAGRAGDVRIIGFDNISAVHDAVERGEIVATADQHADQLAVFGIEYALQVLRDGSSPADKETPVDLVTRQDSPQSAP